MTDPKDLRKIETWLRENKAGVWMAEVCEDAADDIERLRLTDAEREAIFFFAAIDSNDDTLGGYAATLRSLLERLK
jgi:hypothetical protein